MKKIYISITLLLSVISCFSQTKTSYDFNNNFLLNDKPFFPFGCYGIYWENALSEKLTSLTELGQAGMNIVCMDDIGETAAREFTKVLDEAQKNNVKVLIGTPYAPYMKWRAIERKDHPATFGYTISDDADNGKFTLAELANINAEVKKEDPNHITHLTLTGWNSTRRSLAAQFITIADFCSYQCYPICKHRDADFTKANSLLETYKRTLAYVLEAEKANKPFMMLPQTFSWGSQSSSPCYPSVMELRNMVYAGLAAGVKGFISYDFSFDLINNQKPLWKEYADLAKDVKSVQSILFENKLTRHNIADNELVFSSWRKGDTTLFVIVNTSYTFKKNINQKIDWSIGNQLIPFSNRLESPLYIENGTLTGSISPQAVQVYTTVAKPTSLEIEYLANVINIHPNPAKNELLLNGSIIQSTTYDITSIEGKGIQSGMVNSGSISIENLKAGIYFIKIKTDEGEKVLRFVKE